MAERKTTPDGPGPQPPRQVRVWGELSLTASLGDYNFVRPTFGHERWSPSDSPADLRKTAREIHEFNAEEVDKMAKQAAALVAMYIGEAEDVEEETAEDRIKSKARAKRVVAEVEEEASPVRRRKRRRA